MTQPTVPSRVTGAPASALPESSLKDLVQTASRDLSLLVRKEIELAKAEAAIAAKGAAKGAAGLIAAAVFALAAGIMVMFTIAEGFNTFLPRWVAFGVTALLFLVLAGVAALLGRTFLKKVQKPTRAITTVKDDLAWAKHPTTAPTVAGATSSSAR